jgi:hypothetical protein
LIQKEAGMANLDYIQQLLNTDSKYRDRFLKDPVAALAEHGLILPHVMQQNLRNMVSQVQLQGTPVPGAAVGQFLNPALSRARQIPLIIAFE